MIHTAAEAQSAMPVALECLAAMFKEQEVKDPSDIYHKLDAMVAKVYISQVYTSSGHLKLKMRKGYLCPNRLSANSVLRIWIGVKNCSGAGEIFKLQFLEWGELGSREL